MTTLFLASVLLAPLHLLHTTALPLPVHQFPLIAQDICQSPHAHNLRPVAFTHTGNGMYASEYAHSKLDVHVGQADSLPRGYDFEFAVAACAKVAVDLNACLGEGVDGVRVYLGAWDFGGVGWKFSCTARLTCC